MKIISPNAGWLRLLWSDPLPASMQEAVEAAAAIPGCQLNPQSFDASPTTLMLPELHAIFGERCFEIGMHPYEADDFIPRRPLYAHQQSAAAFLLDEGGILADDMGLGKSAAAITAAETRRRVLGTRRYGDKLLLRPGVIVGPLYTRAVWQRELLALGAIEKPEDFCAVVSQDLNDPSFRTDAQWYFVHYDVARFWWSRLAQLKFAVAIVDEIHWVFNGRAKRSSATGMVVLPVPYRIGLTGTPIEKKPSDLWWPLTLAGGARTWGGPLDFRKRYCGAVPNDFGGHVDGDPTYVDELRLRMKNVLLRRTAAEAGLEMPPLTRTMLPTALGGDVADEYKAAAAKVSARDLVAAILVGNVEQVLPAYSRLRALTSFGKLEATTEQVKNCLAQEGSVVVFCWSRQTTRALSGLLGAVPKYRVTGEDSIEVREAAIDAFQASERPAVMIATYGALKEGVTLHRARVVIMHDLDLSISAMLQAEKRIHRIGQKRACQSLWMLAENSVDTLIAPILLRKAELLNTFFDSDVLPELTAQQEPEDVGAAVDRAMAAWEDHR